MADLNIQVAENGFIAYEGAEHPHMPPGKQYAFESAQSLAEFVHDWAEGNTKTSTETTSKS